MKQQFEDIQEQLKNIESDILMLDERTFFTNDNVGKINQNMNDIMDSITKVLDSLREKYFILDTKIDDLSNEKMSKDDCNKRVIVASMISIFISLAIGTILF